MNNLLLIAAAEYRFWLRSYLVLAGVVLFTALVVISSLQNLARIDEQKHIREHAQAEAEQVFLDQPDRHPHRMVHYGHYVFRTPAPLAIFDPGLDPVTGQSIFLEGHRQNSAMFAESAASADLGGLSWLSPAFLYQLFAPLLIILLGHGAIVREREAGVLIALMSQGMTGPTLLAGKALALLSFAALLLLPLALVGGAAGYEGESALAIGALLATYFCYLAIWSLATLWVASRVTRRANILAILAALWLGFTLVLPSVAVDIASRAAPLAEKIETDLAMLADLRELGDGHNANDPAFQKLRADLLAQYQVERVEDLPVNYRGVVALNSEAKLTEVLNQYAQARMDAEQAQARLLAQVGWLTPVLAVTEASRTLSATDLTHYHRFLQEAEALRFDFVQGLNRAHQDVLSYEDDMNRNKGEDAWQKARVDASNWQVLDSFRFVPAAASERLAGALPYVVMLLAWCCLAAVGFVWSAGRLKP